MRFVAGRLWVAVLVVLAVVPVSWPASAVAESDAISRPVDAGATVTKQGMLRVVRTDASDHGSVSLAYALVGDDGVRYKVDFSDPKSRVVNSPAGTGKADTKLLEPLDKAHVSITGILGGRTLAAITTRSERQDVAPASGTSVLDRIAQVFNTWASPLIVIAFIALIVISLRFMPRQKPQRIKPQSSSSVKWDDVAGCEEAKHELREVVEFLREPDRFKRLGASMPKGILLHGPPGTGKTLLAKAVAHESGANFFSQSASSFVEMFAGLGAARIRRLFREARKHAPAILFIDELDAVGLKRGFDMSREKDQTLNQLLVEMDGFDERGELVVIAASNRADSLDPALMRPGRFDRQVLVSPPDLNGRLQILGVHTRGKPVADVDLRNVARQTSGLTGADLANLCNEAAIFAGRTGRETIVDSDFDGALERVVAGLQSRKVITSKEKEVIAYHEAGHALVGELLRTNSRIHRISIVPRGQALGYVMNLPEEDRYLMSKQDLMNHLSSLLGGYVAEQIVFERTTTGAADDLKRVVEISRAMIEDYGMGSQLIAHVNGTGKESLSDSSRELRDREQQALIDEAQWEARVLVSEYREMLDAIAARLLEKETIDRDEIEKVIEAALESAGKTFPEREGKPQNAQHFEPRTRTGRFDRSNGAETAGDAAELPEV
ncbi:MAG: AAA family ATPase [Solirubrobacterales bacterium]